MNYKIIKEHRNLDYIGRMHAVLTIDSHPIPRKSDIPSEAVIKNDGDYRQRLAKQAKYYLKVGGLQ
jgi:hypothetical protein